MLGYRRSVAKGSSDDTRGKLWRRLNGVLDTYIEEKAMKEDVKEIVAVQEVIGLAECMAELPDLQLAMVGGGCGEVVLV